MSIASVMPSNHLILCHPLLLLPSIFPSIRVISNESALCMRWPNYWSFSFNISPSNKHELDAPDGIVVAGDDVVDRLRVGVGVDDRDDGDVQSHRLLDSVGLAHDVDDDDRARELGHVGDAGEVLLELVELAAEHRGLLLVLGELAAVGLGGRLELAHAADGRADGLRVRERAAEPTLGHVELLDGLGRALDELGDLLLT